MSRMIVQRMPSMVCFIPCHIFRMTKGTKTWATTDKVCAAMS
jgi:hypothetical protein